MPEIRHTKGGIEAGLIAARMHDQQWQIGDIVTIGNRLERRLILDQDDHHIIVIAESGWWNTYEKHSDIPIHFIGRSGLAYTYTGREQTYRDSKDDVFTPHFNPLNANVLR